MSSYLALDIGEKRIGVALADVSAPFPAPLVTLEADQDVATKFAELLKKHRVQTVVIGLPRNQKGERTKQTERVEYIASLLNIPAEVAVFWQDESLTSVKAEAELEKRRKPYQKGDVDALAATYILDDFIASGVTVPPVVQAAASTSVPEPATAKKSSAKKSKSAKKPKKKLPYVLLAVVAVLIAGAVAAFGWYAHALSPLSKNADYGVISVESGTSTNQIAQKLEDQKLIRSAFAFRLYVKLHHVTNLQAGSYRISASQSVKNIAKIISKGEVTTVNVLVSPGLTQQQIQDLLEKDGYSANAIQAAFKAVRNHPLLKDLPASAPLEGYLYPDTYKIGPDTSAEQLIRLMLDTFQARITPEITSGIAAQGLSLNQAVILASIVQEEASQASVQPTIAQVFIKRYKQGISLGSDVTALYGAKNDGLTLPKNSAAAAAIAVGHDSPYNTRINTGLPPTAISNFNLSALKAVAQPSNTDYLFFVAGDNGKIYFSNTAAEHDALVQQYCKENC